MKNFGAGTQSFTERIETDRQHHELLHVDVRVLRQPDEVIGREEALAAPLTRDLAIERPAVRHLARVRDRGHQRVLGRLLEALAVGVGEAAGAGTETS